MNKLTQHTVSSRVRAALLALACPTLAIAANTTWDGGGSTDNFSDGLNWVDDLAATAGGTFTFTGSTRLNPVNDLAFVGGTDTSYLFDASAGAFNITGTNVRSGGVTNNSSNLQTVGVGLRFNGGRTLNTGDAGIRLTAALGSTGGARGITKSGAGDLTLAFTGTVTNINYTISAGRLVTDNDTGTMTHSGTTALATGTTLVLAQAGSVAFGGAISGAGQVVKSGAGSASFTAANTYTGGTVVENGILTISQDFTMAGGNGFSLDGSAAPVQGTDFGSIAFTGTTLTYGGSLAFTFAGTAVNGATYNLFDFGSGGAAGSFSDVSIGGSYVGNFTNNSGVWSASTGGFDWTFTESTGDLVVSAIPEPSTFAALAGLVGLGLAASRRRRATV